MILALAADAAQQPSALMQYAPLVLILVFFYILIMRPQQKRLKQHQQLLSELKAGDKVMLSSGIVGKITKTGEKFFTVEIARNVEIQVERNAVAARTAE
ncbi:preprotein translocase subunit YajC [Kingella potus]|uniref:Sec translocon accessory complex subunit YajC n=1 Tax=Kingella potus TaxID=265175 RepID=A0A377QY23_9NEIS|nr:preprotein translocase subunit YajC [Kingella potus]UOP01413.1 preprotein translocase subunit YajC [Kingella potus]STR00266.1 preprotein translocase subunit YajC [Kingella potus]